MTYTLTQKEVCQLATAVDRLRDLIRSIKIANTVLVCREEIRKAVEEYKEFEKTLIFKKEK
jgi:hypothetical protein